MSQEVIHRPLNVKARVTSQGVPLGICSEKSGTGFPSSTSGFPLYILFDQCFVLIHSLPTLFNLAPATKTYWLFL